MPAKNSAPAKTRSPRPKKSVTLLPISAPPRGARAYMWAGVLIISALVVMLWVWSLKIELSFYDWKNTPEQNFWQHSRAAWAELFKSNPTELTKQEITDDLKNALQELQTADFTTTTTTAASATSTANGSSSNTLPTSSTRP